MAKAQIAEHMRFSVPVIEKHLLTARRKLGASTREQALAIAIARREIQL